MGRKKIEIRPLVDERNRNVTFLKRKAGLMKKAWELSVLCAADVSILIFSNSGKPYEFSSRELDGEFDRYLEYEGMIERRRAPEFAAAAAAGEDDDDDDDDNDRRGSIKGKQGGPPGPGKSLKGKESFKARQPSRSDYAKAKRRRRDRRDGSERRGFIEGLISHPSSDEEDDEKPIVTPHDRLRQDSDMSSMAYAMNLHQSSSSYPPQSAARLSYPSQPYRDQPLQPSYSSYNQQPSYPSQPPSQPSYQSAYPPPASQPPSNAFMPNNMQWDQDMLSRYAEFQLQQNHQRQQRILLERQRHQLAELGIPLDDSGLLDQLFAGGVPPPPPQASSSHSHAQSYGTPQDESDSSGFLWPTTNTSRATNHNARASMPVSDAAPAPNGMLEHLYTMGRDGGGSAAREGDEAGFSWPTGQGFLPSPDSAEGLAEKKRVGSPFYGGEGGRDDKRARVY